jgi:hypothetical protein
VQNSFGLIELGLVAAFVLAVAVLLRTVDGVIAAGVSVLLLAGLWHVLRVRSRKRQRLESRSKLLRIRQLKTEVARLGKDPIPARHPALLEQIQVFERAVTHTLLLIARGAVGAGELEYVDLLVSRAAPAALAPLRHTEHAAAIDRARTEFQQMSLKLAAAYLEPNAA